MQWSDVIRAPTTKLLRQFAGLWLIVFGGLALWRVWRGQTDGWTQLIGAGALIVGITGLIAPRVVGPIYSGWMILAFPIGWTLSRVALGLVFLIGFVPLAVFFRLTGRDVLRLKRGQSASYWMPKPAARSGEDYLRQS